MTLQHFAIFTIAKAISVGAVVYVCATIETSRIQTTVAVIATLIVINLAALLAIPGTRPGDTLT